MDKSIFLRRNWRVIQQIVIIILILTVGSFFISLRKLTLDNLIFPIILLYLIIFGVLEILRIYHNSRSERTQNIGEVLERKDEIALKKKEKELAAEIREEKEQEPNSPNSLDKPIPTPKVIHTDSKKR